MVLVGRPSQQQQKQQRSSSSSLYSTTTTTTSYLDGKTKVWIRASAIESIKHPKIHRLATKQLISSSFSAGNGSSINIKRTLSNATTTTVASESGASGSDETDVGRNKQWGWRRGYMIGNTHKGVDVIVVDEDEDEMHPDDDDDLDEVLTLPPNALDANLVVLANEFKSAQSIPQDLITLTHLHEPAVVYSLQQRYAQDLIYTSTGPVLLALNPFCSIRGLYGESQMRKYADGAKQLPPHVYQIAHESYKSMMRQLEDQSTSTPSNQSILVSGESGAGKTVTTKFVMKFLAALSQRGTKKQGTVPKRAYLQVQEQRWNLKPTGSSSSEETTASTTISTNSIEGQVLQSNPILEAFGNARTVRNDNSSRFGKFIEIQFQRDGKLVGASIETYLLEKVRLVRQSAGERNYHVFYQLLNAMPPKQLRQLYLAPTATPADFLLTCASGTYDRRDGVTDNDTFSELVCAMAAMKFDVEEQVEIFGLTAAFLHLSNLEFDHADGDEEAASLVPSNVHLGPVCHLLGVTPEALEQALCMCAIQIAADLVYKPLSKSKAEKGLEALIKATYGSLFTYLVRRINDSIAYKPSVMEEEEEDEEHLRSAPAATIGVLDIFGFESFTTNSFEQLCINYCNEALQQQFNAFVLKNEQEEYEREGIEWSFIQFVENKDVLELMERRGVGILHLLDDHCKAPGTTDKSFCSDVYNKCTGHARFLASRSQVASLQFQVLHYAGPVEYTSHGFVEKNRDELPKQSLDLLLGSSNAFVVHMAELLMEEQQQGDILNASSNSLGKRSSDRRTVGGQFRRQLRELRRKIDLTSPHYIRCLKPNDFLVPHHFDPLIVAEQLRCGGILEAVRVSRAGFTQHYPHADFLRRYRGLAVAKKKETRSIASSSTWNETSSSRSSWGSPPQKQQRPPSKWQVGPNGSFRAASSRGANNNGNSNDKFYQQQQQQTADYKAQCTRILKVLSRKIQAEVDAESSKQDKPADEAPPPPPSKATKYSYKSSSSVPSWRRGQAPSTPPPTRNKYPLEPPKSAPSYVSSRYHQWSGSSSRQQHDSMPPRRQFGSTSPDLTKVGIQVGKTKVFLRHASFEILERLRSKLFVESATKLNAIFRMHLCRIAYLPIRDAYRQEMSYAVAGYRKTVATTTPTLSPSSSKGSPRTFAASTFSLIEQFESQVRSSIHAAKSVKGSRSEWGKQGPSKEATTFKWMLREGLWVRNPSFRDETLSLSSEQQS